MKKTLYSVVYLIIGVYTLSGCIEEFEADIPSEDTDLLVVEGTICSEKVNTFILTRTRPVNTSDTSTPQRVTGAIVSVRGSDGSVYMTQEHNKETEPIYYVGGSPQGNITREYVNPTNPTTGGYYSCQLDALNPDVEYYLHIEYDGEVYESEPQKPLRTEGIQEVRGVQDTPESNINVLITPDTPFEPDKAHYYSWTYDETWEVHSDYTTFVSYDRENHSYIINPRQFPWRGWKDDTSTTIMVGASPSYEGQHIRRLKMYDIDRGDERVYHKYSGLVHQRAISKAEYEYELARRQAGMEMGGLFTPQPSSLPTNIHCLTSKKHVIGFVGCSMNTSEYRFFLVATDYSINIPHRKDARLWHTNPEPWLCIQLLEKGLFLCEWFVSGIDGSLQTAWAFQSQLDVRYKGAYIEEPSYWSLEEDEKDE